MEKKEEYDGINPDKVIEDSRTIRRPRVVVESVQSHPDRKPESIKDAPVPEQESVQPLEREPATPTVSAAAPKRQEQMEPSGRRRELPSYREVFVSRNEIRHRQCVYISHEVHSLVSSLVRVLVEEGGEITVGGYIDKVLYEHLQAYKEEINELYRNRRPELLK